MKQSRIVTNASCLSSSQELWQASSSSREGTPKLSHHSDLSQNVNRKLSLKTSEADAIREASYIGSFPVDEDSQEARAEYIKKHLLNMKATTPAKPVLLLISLSGIKVCCGSGETVFMSHAIKRISYATCQSERRRFSFLAREPKSASNVQHCHTFATKKAGEAEELNNIVANAFKAAYQQQQQQQQQQQNNGTSSANNSNEHLRTTTSFNDLIKAQQQPKQQQQQNVDNKITDIEKQRLLSNQLLCISTSNIDNLCQLRKERKESMGENEENTLAWAQCVVAELLQAEAAEDDTNDVINNNNNNINNNTKTNSNSDVHHENSTNHPTMHHYHPDSRPLHHFFTHLATHTGSPVVAMMDFIEESFTCVFGGSSSPLASSSSSHPFPDVSSPLQPQPWLTPIRTQQPITSSVSMVSMASDAKNRKRAEGHMENFTREYFNKNGRADELNDSKLHEAVWYQPGVPRDVALNQLLNQPNGSFIVRDSSTHPGCYALSIKVPKYDSPNEITHYLIVKTQRNTFKIKGLTKEWMSLTSLVLHHTIMRELLPCLLLLPS